MTEPVVIFGTCRERMAYWEHIDSVLAAQRYLVSKGISVGMIHDSPTYIREGRLRIAQKFMEMEDATHLCFVDSDNMLHEETVWRLLKYNVPVIGALYFKRRGSPEAVAFKWADGEMQKCRSASQEVRDWMVERGVRAKPEPQIIDTYGDSLLQVDVLGFGGVLIRRDVLQHLSDKYSDIFGGHDANIGEDVYFSRLCALEGIPIYVDMANIIGHLAHYDVTLHDFMQVGKWELGER